MIFYHLAKYQHHAKLLRLELKNISSIFDATELEGLVHLNAIIKETLRLYPAVPAGGLRDTPPEGLVIAGKHIPGNVSILTPLYSIGRRELSQSYTLMKPYLLQCSRIVL